MGDVLRAPGAAALLACGSLAACDSKPLQIELDADAGVPARPPAPQTLDVFDAIRVSSNPDAEHYQRATAALDFGASSVARATLTVELESPCFPFDKWTPETVPEGQIWPTLCDAFERALLVSLDDPDDPEQGPPGLELLRAVTPFGGPKTYEADVTDVVNGLPGPHRLRIDIGTYGDPAGQVSGTDGEWIVSARVVLEPGRAPRTVLAATPLVFGVQTSAEASPVSFVVPDAATSGRLEYRATGHGGAPRGPGCSGPADEFCRRTHTLLLDGATLDAFEPWRDDCATLCTQASYASDFLQIPMYCAENPCGAPASVRASRANWCPGSLTPPRVVESDELSVPGEHELGIAIDDVAEGASWWISAVYFAYR